MKALLFTISLLSLIVAVLGQDKAHQTKESVERHIQQLSNQLPARSDLRRALERGARGTGVREPWMDLMDNLGIQRATVWVDIQFERDGKPKKLIASQPEYYTSYTGENSKVSNGHLLQKMRSTGLEERLKEIAVDRAKQGKWVDVPHPRPKPFVGGALLTFYDDEWLPAPDRPLFSIHR